MDIGSFDGLSTEIFEDKLISCDSIEELREEILPMLRSQSEMWAEKIKEILVSCGGNKSAFSKKCGVSRPALDDWLRGSVPKRREQFIRIGLAAGYDREEMDRLLQRFGGYYGLYPKSLEDAICIFVLNSIPDKEQRKEMAYSYYKEILDEIKDSIFPEESGVGESGMLRTTLLEGKLSELREESELEQFIRDNVSEFAMSFRKLYSYIITNYTVNIENDDLLNSIHSLSILQGWRSSLRQCISEIRQNKWKPAREKIISIGIHLSMDRDQINEMLEIAHMEPLCAKNLVEGIIIYILEDASLNLTLDISSSDYDVFALGEYALEVFREINIPEAEEYIKEFAGLDEEDTTDDFSSR